MNWKIFLQSLAAAAVSGAVTSVSSAIVDPQHVDWKHLGAVGGTGAIMGVLLLLKQSPLTADPSPPQTAKFPQTK